MYWKIQGLGMNQNYAYQLVNELIKLYGIFLQLKTNNFQMADGGASLTDTIRLMEESAKPDDLQSGFQGVSACNNPRN
jgi:hypothetical protein